MQQFEYQITDENGIHARPAALLVNQAKIFKAHITLIKDSNSVDIKKIIGVMGLGIKKGDKVTITAEGDDETDAIGVLHVYFSTYL